jgi:transposase
MINKDKNSETITVPLSEYQSLKERCSELETQVKWLMEQLKINNKKTYGSKSEQTEYVCEQLSLLHNEAEFYADVEKKEEVEVASHTRKKKTATLDKLPENIKTVVVEHTLPEEDRVCPNCDQQLEVIGKEVKQTLKIKPAEVYVQEDVYYTYACKNCQKNGIETPVIKAPQEKSVIKGSFASAEAIAHIMTQKFVMYSPLYRQEQDLKRQGIELTRQTMSNWILKAGELWLEPIYERLRALLVKEEVIHADETTLTVLKTKDKPTPKKAYMWLYRTSKCSDKNIVLYDYKPNRKIENAENFLKGFKGYIHADGYPGYHKLGDNFRVVGCFAHCRRKFAEAVETLKKEDRENSNAAKGLEFCNELYEIEKEIADLSYDEKLKVRQEKSKEVLDAFLCWAETINAAPKSKLGTAINYLKNNEKYLRRYMEDGRLEIDNNRAERSIKPFVMGRKNFLFANTESGARGSAVMYSIIETAKENSLDPYKYLTYIFTKAPNLKEKESIEILLPWNTPESCRAKN